MHTVLCDFDKICLNPANMQNPIWCMKSVCFETPTFQTLMIMHNRIICLNMYMHVNPVSTIRESVSKSKCQNAFNSFCNDNYIIFIIVDHNIVLLFFFQFLGTHLNFIQENTM